MTPQPITASPPPAKPAKAKLKAEVFGPLAVDKINAVLNTELAPGLGRASAQAHSHAFNDHRADYPTCHPLVAETLRDPHFIGQAPKHGKNFELLRRVPGLNGAAVLVAVELEPNDHGNYRVVSFYLVTAKEVQDKRQNGHILVVPP